MMKKTIGQLIKITNDILNQRKLLSLGFDETTPCDLNYILQYLSTLDPSNAVFNLPDELIIQR